MGNQSLATSSYYLVIYLFQLCNTVGGGGDRGAGGVREAGEEGAGSGIPKVAEAGEKGKNYATLRNISQSKKMQRDGSQKIQGGNRDYRVREAGGLNPPVPPPPTILSSGIPWHAQKTPLN